MRLRLTAIDAVGGTSVDVVLDVSPDTRTSQVEQLLAQVLPDSRTGVFLGESRLDRDATLEEAGLRSGALVALGGALRRRRVPDPLAELRVVSGPDCGGIHLLAEGETLVGSSATLALPDVAPLQLSVQTDPLGVTVTNLDQDNPVRRNGISLTGTAPVGPDELIEVGPHLIGFVPSDPPDPDLLAPGPDLTVQHSRTTRPTPSPAAATLALPEPPAPPTPPRLDLRLVAIPVVVALPLALLVDPLWLLVLVLSPAVVVAMVLWRRRTAERLSEQAQAAFVEAREAASVEMQRLARAETARRRAACPDAAAVLRTATAPDARLWERRPDDPDFLQLRIGSAALPAESWQVKGPASASSTLLPDVPLTVDLRTVGTLGLVGEPARTAALARWLVAQIAVLHSPEDVSVWLLSDAASEADWGWLRWLPHCAPAPTTGPVHLSSTAATRDARLADLTDLVASRTALAEDARRLPSLPADVVVVIDGALLDRPDVQGLLRDGPAVGVLGIVLATDREQLAGTCPAVVTADLRVELEGPVAGAGRGEGVSAAWADQVARALAPVRDAQPRAGSAALPTHARLLDLLDEPALDAVSVRTRWAAGGPVVAGATSDGVLAVDLDRDGPHVVVAGEGAVELVRALVLGLAMAHSPEDLRLVLVDAGGGGAWAALDRLPHTAAALTSEDTAAVHRAITGLVAELHRRGAEPGTYPKLVLVVDDVEALRAELPSLGLALDRLAEGGGDTGVHLLVSTQQPSAVLTPALRVAAGTRLCLRLSGAAESLEVLDSSAAVTLPARLPGRGFARIRQGPLVPFQAASVSGHPSLPVAAHASDRLVVLRWESVGEPLPGSAPAPEDDSASTDLASVVESLSAAARSLSLPAIGGPWLDDLPAEVSLADLHALVASSGLSAIWYGLADLPAERAQQPVSWDLESDGHLLAVGDAGSGRTTLLTTLAGSLADSATASDAHLYALDGADGSLLPLAALPHCGSVVRHGEPERASRLLSRLEAEIGRRRQQLHDRGFVDLAAQRRGSADPLPYLVLLVDGWEALDPALQEGLRELLDVGGAAGLRAVVAGGPDLLGDPLWELVPDRLVLRLDDRGGYSRAGLDPRLLPQQVGPGRAIRAADGTPVQVARLGRSSARAIEELAGSLTPARGRKPFRVDVLPESITVKAALALGTAGLGAPLGVGGDELRFQAVNLSACGPGLTIAGPAGSGRSTALAVLGRSLLDGELSLCLVAPRPSALRELADLPGVLGSGTDAAGLARLLDHVVGPVAVLVDDADLIEDRALDELLQQVLRDGRQRDRSVVLAGTTSVLAEQSSGFAFEARRSRSGLLLWPRQEDGDLLGVRLPPATGSDGRQPAGRGVLVRTGQCTAVQVPLPD